MLLNKCCGKIPRVTVKNVIDLTEVTISCDLCDRFVVEMTLEQATEQWDKITDNANSIDIEHQVTTAIKTSAFLSALSERIANDVRRI